MQRRVPTKQTPRRSDGGFPSGSADLLHGDLSINHNIIIVHAAPLMRLGITAALYDSALFSRFSISSFRTLEEADTKLVKSKFGDVVVMDIDSWISLAPPNSTALQNIRMRGLALGLIATAARTEGNFLELQGLSGLIGPEAEICHVVSMVQDLVHGRRHFFQRSSQITQVPRLSSLSQRQREILKLMTQGLLNKQIAAELGIKEGTVKCHVSAILEKLNCTTRTQAVTTFIQSSQEY